MARPSTHKLLLTLPEYTWVEQTIRRKADRASEVKEARLKDVLSKFADKLTKPPEKEQKTGKLLLQTNRNELRILHECVKNEHAALVATIIPGYQEKVDRATDSERERLKAYLNSSTARSALLLGILNQIKLIIER